LIPEEKLDYSWREHAACDGVDTELFFPPRDKLLYNKIARQAKEYCNGTRKKPACPVRAECLWEALVTDEQHGIWGGLSHRERNALIRKWQKQYQGKMSLKDYVFKEREGLNGSARKQRP
jgi:WhiB family redox-sensing transcriptional regulator